MSVTVRAREGSPRQCPFCRDEASEDVTPCACGVIYHPDCRAELSRCVTIGCAGKAGGTRGATAHRDVACVRCERLINNDGDMCFGCWSPFHRRCLAEGCCGVDASKFTEPPRELDVRRVERWILVAFVGALFIGVPLAANQHSWLGEKAVFLFVVTLILVACVLDVVKRR